MKICKICKNTLSLASFHKDRKNKDGRKSVCKKCRSTKKYVSLTNARKRFDKNIKHQLYIAIKQNKHGKSWERLFDYTLQDLKNHLEKQFDEYMNWDNFGSYWWIDKIIPCSKYTYTVPGEFHKCWSLKNLRPLYKKSCQKKSNKIYFELVEKYSLFDLLPIGMLHLEKKEKE